MSAKAIIVICAQAFLAHAVFGQCVHYGGDYAPLVAVPSAGVSSCRSLGSNSLAYNGGLALSSGLGIGDGADLSAANIQSVATSGGALPIRSASAIAPSGISVVSENAYQGSLNVIGDLPFLSVVTLEGVLPSGGSGAINYGCGNGVTAITSEVVNSAGAVGLGSATIGDGGIGYGSGLSSIASGAAGLGNAGSRACGCGLY